MSQTPSLDAKCPQCDRAVGDHTFREYEVCLKASGLEHHDPYVEIPGGPLMTTMNDQIMVGEITIRTGTLETPLGELPVMMFTFHGPGLDPMSKVATPEYALVGDMDLMHNVHAMIGEHVDNLAKRMP